MSIPAVLGREPLILRPEGSERRLQPFGQAGRAIVVTHVIKDIGHGKSPDQAALRRAEMVDRGSRRFTGPRSNFAIKAARASGCSFVVR